MIGCTPAPAAPTENSSAANRLLVSVTATAGMLCLTASAGNFLTGTAPQQRIFGVQSKMDESGRLRHARTVGRSQTGLKFKPEGAADFC